MDWIQHPLTQYGLLAAALLATIALFLTVKFEISAGRRKSEDANRALESKVSDLQSALAGVQKSVEDIEERPAATAPGLNPHKRALAIRMHRRGESPESIAASLRTSRSAVELLLKVQEMAQDRSASAAS